MKVWLIKTSNSMTTFFYYQIIQKAVSKTFDDYSVLESYYDIKKYYRNDLYIVGTIRDALYLRLKGIKKLVIWFQGVKPEENYMNNKNIAEKILLNVIEKYFLKRASLRIFVSKAMKSHFEKKYRLKFNDNYIICPCFNDNDLRSDSIKYPNKYNNNVFLYAGSLQIWQCFFETINLYKKIEVASNNQVSLLVLTPDIKKAEKYIREIKINNYEVKFVAHELLKDELSKVKYGFVLRKNVIVNNVSTPTKFSTYISNGVIPIFTSCIKDFSQVTQNFNHIIKLDDINSENNLEIIIKDMEKIRTSDSVYDEYQIIYRNYYNKEKYIKEFSDILNTFN